MRTVYVQWSVICVYKRMYELIYAPALDPLSRTVFLVRTGPAFGLWWERAKPDEVRQDKTKQGNIKQDKISLTLWKG